ncbi:MAG: helix-turn-helix domain-containing protein [Rhodanobacteraceae bacterium]|nr:MAG: helix-turn-helix domain-containing protein [Rhodanobacteraceae bacterium]
MIDQQDSEDLFAGAGPAAPAIRADAGLSRTDGRPTATSIGARLRAARAAKGLTLADCGRGLHLPVKVLQRLEANDPGAPEDFVFLRGAMRGYAKFLGMSPAICDEALRAAAPAAQPALVSVARTSSTRWLLQRYGTAATYIILTATIAVPLVLLGLRGGLHRPAPRVVSLDQAVAATPGAAPRVVIAPATVTLASPDATPFRASITPFGAMDLDTAGAAPDPAMGAGTPAQPAAATGPGRHTLSIAAAADCWFEITDAAGNKIDSGMLHAGDTRSWHADGVLHVTLGNAGGVTVARDGQPLALDDVQHSNVARFDVFGSPGASGND